MFSPPFLTCHSYHVLASFYFAHRYFRVATNVDNRTHKDIIHVFFLSESNVPVLTKLIWDIPAFQRVPEFLVQLNAQ